MNNFNHNSESKQLDAINSEKTNKFPLLDFIFFLVILLSIALSSTIIASRINNVIPSAFGFCPVKILSPSMTNSGYNLGDTALIKKTKPTNLEVGNVIAFYRYLDPFNPAPNIGVANKKAKKQAEKQGSEIWFHEIIDIILDDQNTPWFKTKGSSNAYPDSGYIRGDLVVGKSVSAPKFVNNILGFLGSPAGIILILIVPNGILLVFMSLQLVKELEVLNYQRQIVNGKISLAAAIVENKNIVNDLTKKQLKKASDQPINKNTPPAIKLK